MDKRKTKHQHPALHFIYFFCITRIFFWSTWVSTWIPGSRCQYVVFISILLPVYPGPSLFVTVSFGTSELLYIYVWIVCQEHQKSYYYGFLAAASIGFLCLFTWCTFSTADIKMVRLKTGWWRGEYSNKKSPQLQNVSRSTSLKKQDTATFPAWPFQMSQ